MKLPSPPSRYMLGAENQRNRVIEQADAENHKRNRDVEVGVGRVILTAPNGTRWAIAVSNAGVLSATAL